MPTCRCPYTYTYVHTCMHPYSHPYIAAYCVCSALAPVFMDRYSPICCCAYPPLPPLLLSPRLLLLSGFSFLLPWLTLLHELAPESSLFAFVPLIIPPIPLPRVSYPSCSSLRLLCSILPQYSLPPRQLLQTQVIGLLSRRNVSVSVSMSASCVDVGVCAPIHPTL